MDCNPKPCEKPCANSINTMTFDMYTHTLPRFFCIASRISRFRLQYHSIVIIHSNQSRSSAPQHQQHTTMDGNKILAILLHQLNSKLAFHVKTFTCITCGSFSPSSSNVPISKCHSNTSLVFRSSNHSLFLSLSLNFFSFCFCCHLLMSFEPHSTYITQELW